MTSKKRFEKVFTVSFILLTVGVLYAVLCTYTPFYIPCIFRLATGFKCPGCGVTQMLLSMIKLDFKEAFLHNRVLLLMFPIGIVLTAEFIYRYIKFGTKMLTKQSRAVVLAMIAVLLAFGVFRNILDW